MYYLMAFLLLYGSIFFLPPTLLDLLYREDGVIEWVSAIAWAGASIVFLLSVKLALKSSVKYSGFWLAILCLICFLAAGEEISWGQRAIGYNTPSLIQESNLQGEMNIHNLKWFDVRTGIGADRKTGIHRWLTFNRLGTLIWLGFLVVLPLSFRYSSAIERFGKKISLPAPSVNIAVAAILSYLTFFTLNYFSRLSVESSAGSPLTAPLNECKETVIAVLFFYAALQCFRAVKKSQLVTLE